MKIRREFEQGTDEWFQARLGRVTASNVSKLLTPAKLGRSSQAASYMAELAAERVLGAPCANEASSGWMDRGNELEGEARDWFALAVADVEEVAMIEHGELLVSCSPDGIQEGAFGLEVKCPSAKVHASYVRNPDALLAAYRLQVQLSLWITCWPAWRLLSYCPGLPPVLTAVRPDPEVFAAFAREIPPFLDEVEELAGVLRSEDVRWANSMAVQ